jgi:hypothetical protein
VPTAADKAVDLQPNLAAPNDTLGLPYDELYDPRRAVDASRSALRLSPNDTNPKVLLCLAKTYRKLGRKANADAGIARFQELAKMKSARCEALARELIIFALQGKPEYVEFKPGFSPARSSLIQSTA